MLSDTISEAIYSILNGIEDYKCYSGTYKNDLIENLAGLYFTLFKIQAAGIPKEIFIHKDIEFCKKLATKQFNRFFLGLNDESFEHCEDCYCELCIHMNSLPTTHQGCRGRFCIHRD